MSEVLTQLKINEFELIKKILREISEWKENDELEWKERKK